MSGYSGGGTLVLADDTTGALDTGVRFAQRSISTYVVFCALTGCDASSTLEASAAERDDGSAHCIAQFKSTKALVVDTGSRHDAPSVAMEKITAALRLFADGRRVYKKTDSVLRGNIGAEFRALADALPAVAPGCSTICFVPFYPAQARATRNGVQYVGDVRVDRSVFADDPVNPVTQADIPALLAEHGLTAAVVAPPYDLPQELPDVLVFDGEAEGDLASIARILEQSNLLAATAGCAGFAAYLPAEPDAAPKPPQWELPAHLHTESAVALNSLHWELPALIVSGSANPITMAQIDYARAHGVPVFFPERRHYYNDEHIHVQPGSNEHAPYSHSEDEPKHVLPDEDGDHTERPDGNGSISYVLEKCAKSLLSGQSVILASAVSGEPLLEGIPEGLLQARLAEWTREILARSSVKTWMAIGGDYLSSALKALNVSGVMPLQEALPGVALCQLGLPQPLPQPLPQHQQSDQLSIQDMPSAEHPSSIAPKAIRLLSKSGGFGSEDYLSRICGIGLDVQRANNV